MPQAGLGLMQLKDSALQEGYFLGEIPLATAHVVLTDAQQNRTEGAAQIMHSEASLARAIAIMDAVAVSYTHLDVYKRQALMCLWQ